MEDFGIPFMPDNPQNRYDDPPLQCTPAQAPTKFQKGSNQEISDAARDGHYTFILTSIYLIYAFSKTHHIILLRLGKHGQPLVINMVMQ